MTSIPIKISNARFQSQLIEITVIFIVLILFIIGKDLMHSYVHNYSFYISESILFGSFWLIFIPLALFCKKISHKKPNLLLTFAFSLFHLTFFSLFVFLVSIFFLNHTFDIYQTFINTTSEYGLVCLIIYSISSSLFLRNKTSIKELEHSKVSNKIKVAHQNKIVVLECKNILYIKSEKPYIAIVTKERTYLDNSSLKNFIKNQATSFIQIHKSIVINTDYIVSYTSRKNGDYDIQLANNHFVRASRSFNRNFKPFFDSISLK